MTVGSGIGSGVGLGLLLRLVDQSSSTPGSGAGSGPIGGSVQSQPQVRCSLGRRLGSRLPPRETAASALFCLCFLPSCLHCLSSRSLALVFSCFRFSVSLCSCVRVFLCLCECATSSRLRVSRAVELVLIGSTLHQGEEKVSLRRWWRAGFLAAARQRRDQHLFDYLFQNCEQSKHRCKLPNCSG